MSEASRGEIPPLLSPVLREKALLAAGVLLGLLCLGLYLFSFRPAAERARDLEASLTDHRTELGRLGFAGPEVAERRREEVAARLDRLRSLTAELEARGEINPNLRELLRSPFQVLEFEQRRFDIQQRLRQRADEAAATLAEGVLTNLPSYTSSTESPNRLWARLEFFNHVLESLLATGTGLQVERVEVLPDRLHGRGAGEDSLLELRLLLRATGPAGALADFLNGPLSDRADRAGDSSVKAAYSIEGIDLRSAETGRADLIQMELRLSGFAPDAPVL